MPSRGMLPFPDRRSSLVSQAGFAFPFSPVVRRVLAALWFALCGLLLAAAFALHGPIAWPALCLYVLAPAFSAAIAGFLWGAVLLDSSRTRTIPDALVRGVGVAAGAFLIFTLCFATLLPLVEHGWSGRQVPALFFMALTMGLLAVGPLVLIAGMVAGIALFVVGRCALFARR